MYECMVFWDKLAFFVYQLFMAFRLFCVDVEKGIGIGLCKKCVNMNRVTR